MSEATAPILESDELKQYKQGLANTYCQIGDLEYRTAVYAEAIKNLFKQASDFNAKIEAAMKPKEAPPVDMTAGGEVVAPEVTQ